VTGVTFLAVQLAAKRLQIIHEVVPTATVGYLINPINPQLEAERLEVETAARSLGVRLAIMETRTPAELEQAFANLAEQKVGAILPAADTLFYVHDDLLIGLAARYAVPTIYIGRRWVAAGGLVSYAGDYSDAFRIAGNHAGRILKGEKPANLPVQQSTRTEMVLNLRTAKALGVKVPDLGPAARQRGHRVMRLS
jgi:putative tryptophan/tyrosine transport system substrate-binding protein